MVHIVTNVIKIVMGATIFTMAPKPLSEPGPPSLSTIHYHI